MLGLVFLVRESPGKGEGHNAHTLPGSVGTISAIFQGWRKVPESQLPPYRVFLFPLIQPSYDDDVTQMEQPRSPGNSPCSRWGLAEEALFPLALALSQCWMVELWLSENEPNSLTFKIFFSQKVENSAGVCPAQGLFPFSEQCLLIPAVHSPVPSAAPPSFISSLHI